MLLIRELKPSLKVQWDSIQAKLFAWSCIFIRSMLILSEQFSDSLLPLHLNLKMVSRRSFLSLIFTCLYFEFRLGLCNEISLSFIYLYRKQFCHDLRWWLKKKRNTKVCDRKRGKHSSCCALHFPLQAWLFQLGCFNWKKNEATLSFTTSILFCEGEGEGRGRGVFFLLFKCLFERYIWLCVLGKLKTLDWNMLSPLSQ